MSVGARKLGKEADISTFFEMFKAAGLMQKIFFTVAMLAIYRLGVHIPLIGVDHDLLRRSNVLSSGLLGLVDLFAGGALSALSIFALGIGPYITSSIIMQLMTEVIPALKTMQREQGDQGRKQFQQIVRRTTVGLSIIPFSIKSSGVICLTSENLSKFFKFTILQESLLTLSFV